jgi:hypothetical protein
MSDERTIREDLVIREGSSPEARKGLILNENYLSILIFVY